MIKEVYSRNKFKLSTPSAYMARFQINRVKYLKYFSFKKLGSRINALSQAIAWEDLMQKTHVKEPRKTVNRNLLTKPPKNNTTGELGVSWKHSPTKNNKYRRVYRVVYKDFKVGKYKAKVFTLLSEAVKFRKDYEKEFNRMMKEKLNNR